MLDVLGIAVDKYYACEIDEAAVNITRFHHRDSVIQLGNVCDITQETVSHLIFQIRMVAYQLDSYIFLLSVMH